MNLKFLSWQEGKYSDLWFFVHFLSGVTGGTLFLILGVAEPYLWLACGVLAVLWEIGEWKYKIPESLRNRFLDIVTAFLGAFLGYKYLGSLGYSPAANFWIFSAEAAILVFLSFIGWKSYRIKRV